VNSSGDNSTTVTTVGTTSRRPARHIGPRGRRLGLDPDRLPFPVVEGIEHVLRSGSQLEDDAADGPAADHIDGAFGTGKDGETLGNRVRVDAERVRAGLWLGEAWARFMSDRAQSNAQAILRASLIELSRLGQTQLLQETIEQQRHLPPALLGSPAYRGDKQSVPYVYMLNISL